MTRSRRRTVWRGFGGTMTESSTPPGRRRWSAPQAVVSQTLAVMATLVMIAGCSDGATPAPSLGSSSADVQVRSADSPRAAAEAFAEALAGGDPAPVPFHGTGGAATVTLLLKGMGELRPRVSVSSFDEPADQASVANARLHYEWPISDAAGTNWTYDTTVQLAKADAGWRVALTPDALAPGLATGERLVAVDRPGPRGRILGAGGAVLVTERAVRRIGIDKALIAAASPSAAAPADLTAAARKLAVAVGANPKEYAHQVLAAGPNAFVEAIVLRENDPLLPKALKALGAIPGSSAVSDTLPLPPTRSFAKPLLGSVGPATAEIIQQSNGAITTGAVVGLNGLQRARQSQLAGQHGHRVNALSTGGATRVLFDGPGGSGQDVKTTLSVKHQVLAESLLTPITGPASAIVAIRPSTGDVLAAASGPGGQGNSTATLGLFPPGSTFKVVGALGMLRAGLSPATKLPCTATITVDGRVFKNYDAYPAARLGTIALSAAFAHSCNTAMISQRDVVGRQRLVEAAATLGLTADPALGVPAVLGRVPDESSVVGQAAAMIGQGRVQASPLGMAVVAASVAAGRPVQPRLVITPAPEGSPTHDAQTTSSRSTASAAPMTPAETTALRTLLRGVVTNGSANMLADLPGTVLAKTGTAEYGDANPPLTHAWMIASNGDLAVAVFVETGSGGAKTAGPLMKAFLAGS